jgi:hypothetical protein
MIGSRVLSMNKYWRLYLTELEKRIKLKAKEKLGIR